MKRRIIAVFMMLAMLIPVLPVAVSMANSASAVERIELNMDAITIGVEQNVKTIKPVAYPEGSATEFTWKSEDPSIAKVNEKGKIKGVKKDTTTITVSAGGAEAEVQVIVVKKGKGVTKVTLNKKTASVTRGKSLTLKATLTPKKPKNKTVIWKSSDEAIATVDSKGKVTGVAPGKATITAIASSGKTAKCKVTVTGVKVKKIKLSGNKTMLRNETQQLNAAIKPEDADNKELKWTSSNKKIAKVDGNGVVTALKKGEVTITAAAKDGSGVKGTFKITVKKGIFVPTPTPTPETTPVPTAAPTASAAPTDAPVVTATPVPEATATVTPEATPEVVEDVKYETVVDEEGNEGIAITEYTGNEKKVVIPEIINGLPVTEIADSAFEGNTTIQEIDLPDTIVRIGKRAFAGCTSLRSMN